MTHRPAALALALFASASLAQTYTVTELTSPPGTSRAFAQDLTDSGVALVVYEASGGGTRTYVWQNGTPTDLGVFQGMARNEGNSINESGAVAGYSWAATGFPTASWRWENGVFTNLGSIGGYSNSGGINDAGQITGWASTTTAGTGGSTVVFLHDGVSMKSMGLTPSAHYADASAINAKGRVVGSFVSQRRVSLTGAHIGDMAGGLHELPTLGGLGSNAVAINDVGKVVGTSETGAIGPDNRYLSHGFVWADGVMKDLGTLPGRTQSFAVGINNAGDITGGSYSDSFSLTERWAVLWPSGGGGPIDLNTRIPAGLGIRLTGAGPINASGQILASGVVGTETQWRAYLLTPVR